MGVGMEGSRASPLVTLQPCWELLIVVFLLVEAVSRAESEGLRRLPWVGFAGRSQVRLKLFRFFFRRLVCLRAQLVVESLDAHVAGTLSIVCLMFTSMIYEPAVCNMLVPCDSRASVHLPVEMYHYSVVPA